MDFVDILCDSSRANDLLGLSSVDRDAADEEEEEEEIDFTDDGSLFFSQSETETHTYTYTNDGTSTTGTSLQYTVSNSLTTGPLMSISQPTLQKTTPLFDAIDQNYWSTVTQFLSTGQWSVSGRSRLPVVPLREEARQWSVTLDKSGKVTSRRLPIHAALLNKAPLNVVEKLVELYPNGVNCADSQGNLPLHLAFANNAQSDVIAFLLKSYPEAVLVKNNVKRGKSTKGLLPMECCTASPRSKETKAMIKLCQDKARELSHQKIHTSFDAASSPLKIMKSLSGKSSSLSKETPADKVDSQEQDLMEIRKELDHLRREASGDPSPKPREHLEPLDGWMRSISTMNFQSSFLGAALKPNDEEDDVHLPAIVEAASSVSREAPEDTNAKQPQAASVERTSSSIGRWMNMIAPTSRSHDDEADNQTKESFEVNLASRSIATNASSHKKKRFPSFSNPFRSHKRHASREQMYDMVTVQSGSSKANLSVSRFSLSAVVPDSEAVKKSRGGGSSSKLSKGGKSSRSCASATSSSPGRPRLFAHKRSHSWLPHRSSSTKKQQTNEEGPPSSHESVVFAAEEEKVAEEGVFGAWSNIEKIGLAHAMTNMMLSNAAATKAQHHEEEQKTQELAEMINQKNMSRSLGKSFLKRAENSFLENALLMTSSQVATRLQQQQQQQQEKDPSEATAGHFGKRRNSTKKASLVDRAEESETNDPEDSYFSSTGEDLHTSGTSSNDSVTSQDDESSSCSSSYCPKVEKSRKRTKKKKKKKRDFAAPVLIERRSSRGDKRRIDSAALPETRVGPEREKKLGNRLVRRLSKRNKSRKLAKKERAHDAATDSSDEEERKKTKFGLFRRKTKASEKAGAPSDVAKAKGVARASIDNHDEAELTKKLQLKAAEAHRQAAKAAAPTTSPSPPTPKPAEENLNSVSRHNRQGSTSSRGEGSVATKVLPKNGDWRAEYEDYLSATQSVATTEKKVAKNASPTDSASKKKHERAKNGSRRRPKWHEESELQQSSFQPERLTSSDEPAHCAEDILQDLQSLSQHERSFLLDSATMPPAARSTQYVMKSEDAVVREIPLEKDRSSQSTGPVVSESTVETNDAGNVYLVRVQF